MKKILIIILVAFTIVGVQAQKEGKSNDKTKSVINNPSSVIVYEVDPIPVLSVEQVQGKKYIHDYLIISTSKFDKKSSTALILALNDTSQYMSDAVKKCPFMGKYAISFKKGKMEFTVLISAEPCEKLIFFGEWSFLDKVHLDLKSKNAIVSSIEAMLKGNVGKVEKK